MERIKLLSILAGITLLVVLLNLYGTFSLINYIRKAGAGMGPLVSNSGSNNEPTEESNTPAPPIAAISADDDPFKGSAQAPVVMIEFSDFECPFCKRFFDNTLSQIEEKYIKTGKVKFVYRDFPLPGHSNAKKAAEAGECADEQGKFWQMHDKIFENQNAIGVQNLKQYAQTLGLNASQFNNCLDSGKMSSEVEKDIQDGVNYGVNGTPAFFINGIEISGAQPFSIFEQTIEPELSK